MGADGCPRPAATKNSRHAKKRSENTIITVGYLIDGHVGPEIGDLKVDRTGVDRVETVFQKMDDAGYATSTIDRRAQQIAHCDGLEGGNRVSSSAADGSRSTRR